MRHVATPFTLSFRATGEKSPRRYSTQKAAGQSENVAQRLGEPIPNPSPQQGRENRKAGHVSNCSTRSQYGLFPSSIEIPYLSLEYHI